jgi:hypothetical protein
MLFPFKIGFLLTQVFLYIQCCIIWNAYVYDRIHNSEMRSDFIARYTGPD